VNATGTGGTSVSSTASSGSGGKSVTLGSAGAPSMPPVPSTGGAGTMMVAGAGSGGAPVGAGPSGAGGAMMTTPPPPPGMPGNWPAADPTKKGPYMTVTEMNTGPDGMFTMFRPMDLGSQLHPVITWGNGTGTTPMVYAFLLDQLASHGFIVIASNSMNVAQGTPPPMIQGVDWVIQENADPMSPLYQHVDTTRIGATGHSQGAFATTTAGSDARITAIAPIEGTLPNGMLHGPALLLCGSMDTTVGCMGAQSAFSADTVPCMYAELTTADHTNWIGGSFAAQFGGAMNPFVIAVTAWMRVHLMDDATLRPMFYGSDCGMCKDTTWKVMQKMLN
jgi:hypothetical protein